MIENVDNQMLESKIDRRKAPRSDEVRAEISKKLQKRWEKLRETPDAYDKRCQKTSENKKEYWKKLKEDPVAYNEMRKKMSNGHREKSKTQRIEIVRVIDIILDL